MTGSIVLAFIHHLAAFTLFASILFEHLTFKRDITVAGAIFYSLEDGQLAW
jgi:uncharacterized membrane protein